jgi:hypothetical protein
MGRMKRDKRIIGFLLGFDKKGERVSKNKEVIIKGRCGTQS